MTPRNVVMGTKLSTSPALIPRARKSRASRLLGSPGELPGSHKDRRRNDTRDRIVNSAIQLFGAKGYNATSIAEIEGAVGLRPGSGGLYRHFPSKEALFVEAITGYRARVSNLRHELAAERESRVDAGSLKADLRRLVAALAKFVSGEQPVVQATADTASLPAPVRRIIGEAWDEAYGMAEDIFTAHEISISDARISAVAAIGSLNHYVSHLGYWGEEPNGVPIGVFVDEWVRMWAACPGQGA